MSVAAVERLRNACRDGKFYDELEYFNTILARKAQAKKDRAASLNLLLEGIRACAEFHHATPSLQVARQLFKQIFFNFNASFDETSLSDILAVADALQSSGDPSFRDVQCTFLEESLRWARDAKHHASDSIGGPLKRNYDTLMHRAGIALLPGNPTRALLCLVGVSSATLGKDYDPPVDGIRQAASAAAASFSSVDRPWQALRAALLFLAYVPKKAAHQDLMCACDAARAIFGDSCSQVESDSTTKSLRAFLEALLVCIVHGDGALADSVLDTYDRLLRLEDVDDRLRSIVVHTLQQQDCTVRYLQRPASQTGLGLF